MSELRDRVAEAKVFSKIDLKDGYHLIRIRAGNEWKTAFRTLYAHYKYKVMPFGLVNTPATFQAMMHKILREFLGPQGSRILGRHCYLFKELRGTH